MLTGKGKGKSKLGGEREGIDRGEGENWEAREAGGESEKARWDSVFTAGEEK